LEISKILVAVDGSEYSDKAFEYATMMFTNHKALLLVVHIIEELGNIGYSISNQMEQDSQLILQQYQTKAENKGLQSSLRIIEDRGFSVAEKILEIAEKEKADTIVVGTKGQKPTEQFLLGSTSYKVAHYSKCTVVIVK
jgi:nucleotide-binding universal stress UspA family protein